MRKTNIISLMAACILLSSGLLHAEQESDVQTENEELCKAASYIASIAFQGHQRGEKKKEFLDGVDELTDIPNAKKGYLKKLVEDAFNKPIYSSKEEQDEVVQKFNKDKYDDCMKKESSTTK